MEIKNSPDSWNTVWNRIPSTFPGSRLLENWYRSIVYFSAFNKLLKSVSLSQKDVLELGSGTGNNSLYLSRKYPLRSVTLMDFSDSALQRTQEQKFPCKVTKLHKDLLEFRAPLPYGFVHSTGLIEHFYGAERMAVVQKHAECVEKNGYVMIWVPVRSFMFSLIWQFNKMQGIEEVPLTEQELKALCVESGLRIINEGKTAFGALYGVLAQKM
ncbi:MAG: class I SAM-dependent methyltransferase [bacterium]|nr:class I SAM-dependent methyltransferase [bacterium]